MRNIIVSGDDETSMGARIAAVKRYVRMYGGRCGDYRPVPLRSAGEVKASRGLVIRDNGRLFVRFGEHPARLLSPLRREIRRE
jgi:hypothetical protein